MPASAELSSRPRVALVDTSVAVALVVADHEHHATAFAALGDRTLGLAGHAAFETFSVLTRLPPPARRPPAVVAEVLADNFPATTFLPAANAAELLRRLPQLGIGGGSVYDALVAAAATAGGLRLFTLDRRAVPVYRTLEVDVEVLAGAS